MKRVWSKSFPFCVDYFLVAKCSVVVSLSWKILFWMRHSLRTLFRQWLLPFCDLSLLLLFLCNFFSSDTTLLFIFYTTCTRTGRRETSHFTLHLQFAKYSVYFNSWKETDTCLTSSRVESSKPTLTHLPNFSLPFLHLEMLSKSNLHVLLSPSFLQFLLLFLKTASICITVKLLWLQVCFCQIMLFCLFILWSSSFISWWILFSRFS